jgi:hypothetical protein
MAKSSDSALIGGVVVGVIVLLALIGVVVVVGLRRRCKSAPSHELPTAVAVARSSTASNCGAARDAPPPARTSEYGAISTCGEYASIRPDNNYATVVRFDGARTAYGVLTQAELGDM